MNKNEVMKHYSRYLDELIDNSLYFQFYFQAPVSLDADINNSWEDLEDVWNDNIHLNFGISRGCLVDDEYPFVVKFDVLTPCYDDYFDFCSKEVDFYKDAEKESLSQYFSRASFIGYYNKEIVTYNFDVYGDAFNPNGNNEDFLECLQKDIDDRRNAEMSYEKEKITISIPLYAYERAEPLSYFSASFEETTRAHSVYKNSPLIMRTDWIGVHFIKEYGEEEYCRLSDFLVKHRINDLHCGNIGEICGKMVLIDYAGYHESSDY